MKLRDLLTSKGSKVWTVRADATIHDALQTMCQQNIGALLVTDARGRVFGIISERDIMRLCYRKPREFEKVSVEHWMTTGLITADIESDTSHVMELMTVNRIRHVPVMEEGRLAGLVSIGDVVKALLNDSRSEIQSLKDFINGPGF